MVSEKFYSTKGKVGVHYSSKKGKKSYQGVDEMKIKIMAKQIKRV